MKNIIESLNIIDALSDQIEAILDLLQGCGESTDIKTVNTAAEMTVTMFDDLMSEVREIAERARGEQT